MLRLIILLVSQDDQGSSCSISHTSLERPPRSDILDHLEDMADLIYCGPLIDDHTYMPQVRVPSKQPRGSNEKGGLAISQQQEQCSPSPRKIASKLTITMRLRGHGISTWCGANMLRCRKLPCRLEKRRKMRLNNH
jgi:hypothetical protein